MPHMSRNDCTISVQRYVTNVELEKGQGTLIFIPELQ